ncbi:2-oxoglutarate dehydrogenase, E2 component, dihydrolipoamide succinyltransferase [Arthrobacter dokdonensis]|uniref:2-oxoglutarate dehydrogenase, E2 component, dihydrolipoamide succinyltransferase n=1 Tax=Arthrobacter dokdonellae TaxID=2211210 RepID=UPI003AAC16E3
MPEAVVLPELGESVTEGTVTRWLKDVGDAVEVDEPLLEVSTDKVDTELPSPFTGVLEAILVREDQSAAVGQVLAHIGSAMSEPAGSEKAAVGPVGTTLVDAYPVTTGFRPKKSPGSRPGGTYVTPLVRKLARQNGVELDTLAGTGVRGRIRRGDVLAAVAAEPHTTAVRAAAVPAAARTAGPTPDEASASLRGTTVKAPRIRQVIARRMRESLTVSTQLTQVHEVDLTALVRLREDRKAAFASRNGVKLTFLPFIAVAVAEALKRYPMLNAEFDEGSGTISYHDAEHLAFAVDTPKGLLVPVVRNTGTLNLAGMARGIADVAARARAGSIGADELSGGTFSITNIGSVGALFDTPILNQPQVGILGIGAIVKRPGVVTDTDGADVLGIRHMMYLCLTYDHRLVDGADAGRFLQTVTCRLEAAAFEA